MTDLRDARDRWSAANETDRSLLVEASAGTGKTKTLVDRIANLVLADPEEGGISLSEIAALTFTEKAAGEMKERLRGCLEDEMKGARRARAKSALESLDLAEIATIHAFCARLLRERPVEAGVDPDFTTPEPAVIRELFDEVFPGWLDAEARVPKGVVAGLLARGLHPDELSELAWKIHEGRALLQDCTVPVDALSEAREALDELARGFRKLIAQAPGWKGAGEMTALARQLEWLAGLDITGLSQSAVEETFALRNAPKDEEWRERATTLRDRWKKLREALPALPDRVLLAKLVPRVKETLFPLVTAAKRERRLLDFDDLLLTARDLLRHSAPARAHFADRFRALLVDEFQDTDPVQAEIVLRLSAPDGGAAWGDLEIAGGELFVVGDPKQSIYRFRRADVETYDDVSGRFDVDSRLRLATSFRSHPRLVGWINAVFEQVLVAHRGKPWEVEYSPLEPGPVEDAPGAPVVYLLPPDEIPEGTRIGELREMEARAIARWLATRAKGRVPWRDVGILVPKNDAIDVMEKALREAGIPSVAEGGKSYSLREETGAVLAALRAVADPGDGIALAAVLRSFLFSASDADLVEAAEKGFRFDVAGEAPEGCAIAPAVALIQRLRAGRHERPTSETLLELLEQRAAFAALEAGGVPNPRQGVANVERLVASARACDASGLSFREAVAALVRTLKVESPEPRAFEENEDAVRLLTLHKSKGLEFPLVVLASLGLEDRTRGGDKATLRCERPGGLAGVKATVGDRGSVATPRWDRVVAADEERLRAEDRRLLYVGATRAKKQLVVSWWVDPRGKDALAKSYLGPMAAARSVTLFPAGDVEEVVSEIEPFTTTAVKSVEEAVDLAREMSVAAERLERARATASRKLRRAGEHAFVPARAEDLPASDRGDEEVSDRALRVGVAVHGAMERLLDPGRAAPPLAAVLDEAAAELPADARAEVKRLVERLLEDPVVARARAAKRRFVEVPLLHREGAGEDAPLVEGKIDLLFEEADGLVVVDWKTDRVDSPAVLAERTALYAPQLASYEEGLKKALGPGARVKECRLVFART